MDIDIELPDDSYTLNEKVDATDLPPLPQS
jgi:hypothetical protein